MLALPALIVAATLLPQFSVVSAAAAPGPPAPIDAPAPTDDERMAWWREARFGLFIHWGLYAIPAGAWGDRTNYGEWIRHSAQIPIGTYDRFRPEFNPTGFDAHEWMALAADAGMKYVVITSKHHDGFCLFDSQETDFDIMSTPYRRDIMTAIAESARSHDLVPCWYHSIMDWHHPDYLPRRGWEAAERPADGADFDRFERYLHDQVTELLTNYGDIGVMWFDGEWENTWTHERGARLYELCRRLQPDVLVNNRVDKGRNDMAGLTREGDWFGDFGTPEQQVPPRGLPGVDWEACITMNSHWGWNAADMNWKSSDELIRMLCDIVSKGGNFLLNVGPKANGTFPDEAVERLKAIGAWMSVNGQSIHCTQASPFESIRDGRATWKPHADGTAAGGGTLYLQLFEWPADGVLPLPGLVTTPVAARVLGGAGTTFAQALRVPGGVELRLEGPPVHPAATVVALRLDDAPIVCAPPSFEPNGGLFVDAIEVRETSGPDQVAAPGSGERRGDQPAQLPQIRHATDGSTPTAASPLLPAVLEIDRTTTITAQWFLGDEPIGAPSTTTWTRAIPRAAVTLPQAAEPGLPCTISYGSTRRLHGPDAAVLAIDRIERTATFEIPASVARREHVRLDYAGFLRVDAAGVYEFSLTSDDGSRLLVGDELVVDNDGLHGPHEVRGRIALDAEWHPIRLSLFNATGGFMLDLKMARVGRPLESIPADRLRGAEAP